MTTTVTMMPDIAARIGVPRAVGVEFPFGHALGPPGDESYQRGVVDAALDVAEEATEPGTIVHLDLEWPNPLGDWHKRWQPKEPAPIIKALRGN